MSVAKAGIGRHPSLKSEVVPHALIVVRHSLRSRAAITGPCMARKPAWLTATCEGCAPRHSGFGLSDCPWDRVHPTVSHFAKPAAVIPTRSRRRLWRFLQTLRLSANLASWRCEPASLAPSGGWGCEVPAAAFFCAPWFRKMQAAKLQNHPANLQSISLSRASHSPAASPAPVPSRPRQEPWCDPCRKTARHPPQKTPRPARPHRPPAGASISP